MRNYNPFKEVNRPYRSQAEAEAMLGQLVTVGWQSYKVTRYNDLGCLYGVKVSGRHLGKTEYVLG